jgi:hypothetical protein
MKLKNARTILAAAVLGVSTIALPSSVRADDFKKTQIDDIPREARDAIKDQTKNKKDVEVFARHMDGGETQYTAFYMDDGKRMEFRVDKDGKVTSAAHETREQPGDKDRDHDKDRDKDKKHDDNKKHDSSASADADKEYNRESTSLSDIPKPAQDALNKELQSAKAKEGDYFRLRQQGDDIYSMFYTPDGGQRREVRVDKNGKVLGHFGDGDASNDVAKSSSEDAAQPAGARQPAKTSGDKTTAAQPAPAKTPAPATPAPAETTELREVKASDLPKPVAEAFKSATFQASQVEYRTWSRDGKTYYSAFYLPKGSTKQMEFRTDADGKKLEDAHEAQSKK